MHSKIIDQQTGPQRTHLVFFDTGEEAVQGLTSYVTENGIETASFTAIGGFAHTRLGFFNRATRGFDEIAVHQEPVEVLSLSGDILTSDEDVLTVHGHVVVGRQDGSTAGGHLLVGEVDPILIVTLVELEDTLAPHAHH